MKKPKLIDLIKSKTKSLHQIYANISKREERKQKLIDKNLFIDEAAPKYKE